MLSIPDAKNKCSVNHTTGIEIVGMINTIAFQKAKWCAQMLHDRLPSTFTLPKIREMFQIEWYRYLKNARRHFGGRMWLINRPVAVFIKDEYIGSDIDFIDYINEIYVISIPINPEFYENLIINSLKMTMEKSRFVYFTFAIDGMLIGSLLFMISELVIALRKLLLTSHFVSPTIAVACFHSLITEPIGTDLNLLFVLTPIHGWMGITLLLGESREVHIKFWFQLYYHRQLIDGAATLKKISSIPTHYESPTRKIVISQCGEYCFGKEPELEVSDICMDHSDSFEEDLGDGVEALDLPHSTE